MMHLDQYALLSRCSMNFLRIKWPAQMSSGKSDMLLNQAELAALLLAVNDPILGLPSTLPRVACVSQGRERRSADEL